jgi:hypothetical protein
MIPAGTIYQQDIRELRQSPDGLLQQETFAQCQQTRLVGGARFTLYYGSANNAGA